MTTDQTKVSLRNSAGPHKAVHRPQESRPFRDHQTPRSAAIEPMHELYIGSIGPKIAQNLDQPIADPTPPWTAIRAGLFSTISASSS